MSRLKPSYLRDPPLHSAPNSDSTLQTAHSTTYFIKGTKYMGKYSEGSDLNSGNEQRQLIFTDRFKEDLKYVQMKCPGLLERIRELIKAVEVDPFKGKGHPELLKYEYDGEYKVWSRKIDKKNRLTYKVTPDGIYFLQARYHYKKHKK